jgi:hypothetical protein
MGTLIVFSEPSLLTNVTEILCSSEEICSSEDYLLHRIISES